MNMADGPYTTISRETWIRTVRALDSGDPDAMNHAYDEFMQIAPPGWGDLLDEESEEQPEHTP